MERQLTLQHRKRSIEWYLRALWAKGFVLHEQEAEEQNAELVSYVDNGGIFLPATISPFQNSPLYYHAAACHAASHIIYGGPPFNAGDLNLIQRSVIGLVEDLRVELLAIKQFPGLRRLWLTFHHPANVDRSGAQQLLWRLSRSVLTLDHQDEHAWVSRGRDEVVSMAEQDYVPESVQAIGLRLANDLGQMRLPLNSGRYEQAVIYRDDNRCLWQQTQSSHEMSDRVHSQSELSWINTRFKEQADGRSLPLAQAHGSGLEGYLLREQRGEALEYREATNKAVTSEFHYPEWDYRSQVLKRDWCAVTEQRPEPGSSQIIDTVHQRYKMVLARLQRLARRLYTEKLQRLRKLEEGDDIDHQPMVNAMVALRSGQTPDTRIFMRNSMQQDKDLAITIVLDLSESTNEAVIGTTKPIYELLRDSVLLLGEALTISDESFAIYGFCSNGRQQVIIKNYKSFTEPFRQVRQRLATIEGSYSTRLGAAIRHCARQLAVQPQRRKLLLVITDGVPSDVDVFDQTYLQKDSWHAVRSLTAYGIKSFCVNLDRRADSSIEKIFGRHHFETLENVIRLPEVLSRIYFRFMR